MSNNLSVRRVKFQTIDKEGLAEGVPTYGVMAADDYENAVVDCFSSLPELNKAVEEAGDLLTVADDGHGFDGFNRSKIGTEENFYGSFSLDELELGDRLLEEKEEHRRDHQEQLGPDAGEPR